MATGAAGMGDDDGMVMMMPPTDKHMAFFWGRHVEILFSGWPGDRGIGMYVLALLFVFVIAAIAESLSFDPLRLSRQTAAGDRCLFRGILLAILTAVRTGLSYLVMLAVMSFNVGVLLAAVAGHALGFFVFGSGIINRSVTVDEIRPDGQQPVPPTKC